jgi:hypothetical protein
MSHLGLIAEKLKSICTKTELNSYTTKVEDAENNAVIAQAEAAKRLNVWCQKHNVEAQ